MEGRGGFSWRGGGGDAFLEYVLLDIRRLTPPCCAEECTQTTMRGRKEGMWNVCDGRWEMGDGLTCLAYLTRPA